ncbi:MAG: competence/damage-inducible protein CinA [bacterium]|nr:MAG: competence/damage-inducible protein CinA [bacterium]
MDKNTFEVVSGIHGVFREKGLTLSVAESCTGGLISHYITSLPGASAFFEAGVVTYSIESKERILGVSPEIISTHGVVSEETARDMAEKVRQRTGTECSISTTGNLGPDVLEDKEAGLVYMAVSTGTQTLSREMRFTGDRGEIKESAALAALKLLLKVVKG